MPRAAIYCRISRDRVGAGLGVERQEADCRALAARLGLVVVLVLADNDLSAYSGKPRPAYRRLLGMVTAGEVDAVLAWHGDRLHRSISELEDYIGVCEARDVPTYTATAGELDLTTATGRMHARIAGAVARHEVEHSIERQQAAKLQAAASGKWGGGRRPYGYEADGITVCEVEAAVVTAVTDEILVGSSLRAQTASLNARGLVTSTGRPWAPTELRRVLIRPRNAGLREHRGEIIGKAEWDPLVPEEKWRAVRAILTDPARRQSFATNRKWLLSGVAICGVCGSSVRGDVLHNARGSVPSYTCRVSKCVGRNAGELDRYITGLVIEWLSQPAAVTVFRRDDVPDVVAIQAEVSALRERLDGLAALYADGAIDGRQLQEGTQRLQNRLAPLQEAMASAASSSVLAGIVDAADVGQAWEAIADLDRKTAIVDILMTVIIHKGRKGRPAGWRPGQSYFDRDQIQIVWKT